MYKMIPAEDLDTPGQAEIATAEPNGGSLTPPRSRSPVNRFTEPSEFSVDEAIAYLGSTRGRFQTRLLFGTGTFMVSTSLQFSILSFLGSIVQCQMPEWGVTDESAALLSTLVFFGMFVGTVFWGYLSDIQGRKPVMLLVAISSLFFSLIRAFSHDYGALLAIQFFLGAALSGFGVAFTYFLEFFPAVSRASWGMLLTVFWTVGMVLGILISWALEPAGFRALCIVSSIPCLVNVFAMYSLPRSPQFLVVKGRLGEARDVFAMAGAINKKPFPIGFVIVDRSSKRIVSRAPVLASLGPKYRRTTLLLYFIWFALGFCYYGVMMMASNIQDARSLMVAFDQNKTGHGYDNSSINLGEDSFCPVNGGQVFTPSDYAGALFTAIAELPGIAIAWLFVDRAGRKATQTGACIVFAVSIFILGVIPPTSPAADLILLFIARGLSNTGFSVTWIYTPEVFPASFRTTAFAVSECFSHLGAMLTPFVGQTMLANGYLPSSCFIYCASGLLGAFASYSLKVETAGKEFATDFEDDFPRQFSSARPDVELPPIEAQQQQPSSYSKVLFRENSTASEGRGGSVI